MTHKLALLQTMRAEMEPDCYGGKSCDKLVPQWHGHCDGEKDSEEFREPIKLDPRHFPPGTVVTVSVPICPACGEPQPMKYPPPKRGSHFEDKCRCGFDWKLWALSVYS